MGASLSWNVVDDVRQLLTYPFMVNALRAGTIVAVVASLVGYFMVLRRQAFAGHTLALVGFPGAAGATWLGFDASWGFFAFAIGAALVLSGFGDGRRGVATASGGQSPALIATVQAFALALGMLFVSRYHGLQTGVVGLLFGTIVGVSNRQVVLLLASGGLVVVLLAVLGRPLLFATLDPDVARARGVPTRAVGVAFMVLLGIGAAGASQVTGSLLVFALLVAPAAAAVRLTARPTVGLALSVLIGVGATWLGEAAAYFSPYPVGFWVTTFGFAAFLLASAWRAVRR